MQLIVVLLVLVVILLAGLCAFLFFYYVKINKDINLFLEKGNIKDAKDILFAQVESTKELQAELQKALDRIKSLEEISLKSVQKIGVVRFNPFDNMGGNQSFTIALLDNQNNGFVISSLFIKEGNRVYAKQIIKGKSEHVLSEEEKESINRAIGSQGSKK